MTCEDECCLNCGNPLPVCGSGGYFHAGDCLDRGPSVPVSVPLPEDWPQCRQIALERADCSASVLLTEVGVARCGTTRRDRYWTCTTVWPRRYQAEAAAARQDIHDLNILEALCRDHHRSETQGEFAAADMHLEETIGEIW